jgi:hypothetical protein
LGSLLIQRWARNTNLRTKRRSNLILTRPKKRGLNGSMKLKGTLLRQSTTPLSLLTPSPKGSPRLKIHISQRRIRRRINDPLIVLLINVSIVANKIYDHI